MYFGFIAVLLCAPLPLASNRAWSLGMLALAVWGLVALAATCCALQEGGVAQRLASGRWPIVFLTVFCVLIASQLVGLTPGLRRLFVDTATTAGPVSIDPTSTRLYLLTALTHLGGFLATLLLLRSRERLIGFAAALVASGLIQAMLGIGLLAYGEAYVYLGEEFSSPDRATGTFPNTDHLANYLALCLSIGLGLLLSQLEFQAPARNRTEQWLRLVKFVMSTKMLLRLMLIVMVIALVLTRSRGGNLAFFTSLLVVGGALAWRSPQLRRGALWLVASVIVVDVVVVGQWVGLDRVVQRLEETAVTDAGKPASYREETLEQRLAGARDALPLIYKRPLIGFGGGTFYAAFPVFKRPDSDLDGYDHSHNDYVEIAADTGVAGLILLAAVVVASLRRIARLMNDDEPRYHRGLAAGLAMAVCAMLIHALVDFPLQIPANALTFTVLLASAWTMKPGGRRLASSRPTASPTARRHATTQ